MAKLYWYNTGSYGNPAWTDLTNWWLDWDNTNNCGTGGNPSALPANDGSAEFVFGKDGYGSYAPASGPTLTPANEIQTIAFSAVLTGGTFTVTVHKADGTTVTSPPISPTASMYATGGLYYQFLAAYGTSAVNSTFTSGSDATHGFRIEFAGTGYADLPQTLVTVNMSSALPGGTTATVSRTTVSSPNQYSIASYEAYGQMLGYDNSWGGNFLIVAGGSLVVSNGGCFCGDASLLPLTSITLNGGWIGDGGYGKVPGGITFNGGGLAGTVMGDAVFQGGASCGSNNYFGGGGANGTVNGNAIFYDTSQAAACSVGGNATFNDASAFVSGAVSGITSYNSTVGTIGSYSSYQVSANDLRARIPISVQASSLSITFKPLSKSASLNALVSSSYYMSSTSVNIDMSLIPHDPRGTAEF